MDSVAAGGAGLIGASVISVSGSLAHPPLSGLAYSAGAWLAATAVAIAYRRIARAGRAVPAASLALLGVAASARTVDTTLHIAYPHSIPDGSTPATAGSSVGLALLAWALLRAGLVGPVVSVAFAVGALAAALTTEPALPYLLGAAPLGVVLITKHFSI
jgi:hypothetical protein